MKNTFLVSLVVSLAILAVLPLVFAATLDVSNVAVEVNEMDITSGSVDVAVEAGETIPIDVYFTADEDASDVEISAWIQGERSDAVEKDFRDLLNGKRYHSRLSLALPANLDEIDEPITLYVRIETDAGNWEEEYTLSAQREPEKADILFVEVDNMVEAGSRIPVDVVVKNLGRDEIEDLVVEVSIPELGISKRAYFGDLDPTDDETVYGEDAEDAASGRLYLKIPSTVNAGTYELIVEAYNSNVQDVVSKALTVTGAEQASEVLVPVTSKEIGTGQEKTYSVVIVNVGDNIGIYEIVTETAEGVIVSVTEPIVTVQAGTSRVVEVNVKAGSREGTYSFAVNVNSDGKLVGRAVMNANVTEKSAITGGNLTILTVILAIVFIVLLIVLIVLLTRKPEKPEEFEESYY